MASKKGWKYVTEKEFEIIKTLQGAGVSEAHARGATGRSAVVLYLIYSSNNLSEYRQKMLDRRKKKLVEPKIADETMATQEQPYEAVLERIAVALEALVAATEKRKINRLF